MCILLEHANHKELLTSTNNGVKTLEIAVTASKWETRCCIYILHPSAWEYQSAALGYNYHTARQSGAATVRYISYHPVITNLSPCCGATQSLS